MPIINFDELPANTIVRDEFRDQGIIFLMGITNDNPSAPSARNALQAEVEISTVEMGPVASVEGSFTDPHHARIGMFVVLKPGSASGGSAQLTVFKFNSSETSSITIDVPPGQLASFGEISSPIKNIAGFKMSGS